jgi:hypothetical protein
MSFLKKVSVLLFGDTEQLEREAQEAAQKIQSVNVRYYYECAEGWLVRVWFPKDGYLVIDSPTRIKDGKLSLRYDPKPNFDLVGYYGRHQFRQSPFAYLRLE